jgi:anti-sigma factor RsiW
MNDPHAEPVDQGTLRELLVAYLDGELDSTASLEIERCLAAEPRVQQELQQLQQTWDLLDRLPRAEVDAKFTRSTVEMIAVVAEEETTRDHVGAAVRRRRWGQATGLLIAAAAGFILARIVWPEPNQQLLQDLPVVENLEAYRQTPDLEFLKQLNEAGTFAEESSNES